MNQKFTIEKRLKSFTFAINGLFVFFRTQHNAWIHSLATAFVVALGYILELDAAEWAIVVIAIALVFVAEIANTAIEFLVDWISPEYNRQAGLIKDIAAGAVLLAAIAAATIGLLIFLPKIVEIIWI